MKALGLLGPVRYSKSSAELRKEGYLTDVTVNRVTIYYGNIPRGMTYTDEMEFLEQNGHRNMELTKLIFGFKKNSLIMVNHLDHGFTLQNYFEKYNKDNNCNKKIYFIRGEVEVSDRDAMKKLMEEESDIIVIAITKIFSTGINIKNLHNIILASGGKSSVTVVQTIGRGLRLHPEKKELNIWDISDSGCKYSLRHLEKRLQIYQQEKILVKKCDIIDSNE